MKTSVEETARNGCRNATESSENPLAHKMAVHFILATSLRDFVHGECISEVFIWGIIFHNNCVECSNNPN